MAKTRKPEFYPIILAGGRGTRFWPLSRKNICKTTAAAQLRAVHDSGNGRAVAALRRRDENFWIITNGDLRQSIARQLKSLPRKQIIAEPVGRNTAPAIGLAAFILHRRNPDAVLGLFPSDQVIQNEKQFRKDLQTGIALAAAGENIVVMGVKPTRPETGYGYVEAGPVYQGEVTRVRCFREKPEKEVAEQFLAAGNFYWNSGMFLWSAQDSGERPAAISAGNGGAAGKNRGNLGHAQIRRDAAQTLPEVRGQERGLRNSRAAFRSRRRRLKHLLHSGRLGMERPGFLGRTLRASHRTADSTRTTSSLLPATSSSMPTAITFTRPGNSLPQSECKAWW